MSIPLLGLRYVNDGQSGVGGILCYLLFPPTSLPDEMLTDDPHRELAFSLTLFLVDFVVV
jgi:hypothetical protein